MYFWWDKCLSYRRAQEIFLVALPSLQVGLDTSKFGLHSLAQEGLLLRQIRMYVIDYLKNHGRWKSDSTNDGYVPENNLQQLSVSKKLLYKGRDRFLICCRSLLHRRRRTSSNMCLNISIHKSFMFVQTGE